MKTIRFLVFLIVLVITLVPHYFWWFYLVPSVDDEAKDPIHGIWVGYFLFVALCFGINQIFYVWWRRNEWHIP